MDELEILKQQETEFQRRAEEARQRRIQLEKKLEDERIERERNTPAVAQFSTVEGDRFYVKLTKYDEKIVNLFRSIRRRVYHGEPDKLNSFPVEEYEKLITLLQENTVPVTYDNGVKERIDAILSIPNFDITLSGAETKLNIKVSRYAVSNILMSIPGYVYEQKRELWTIPVAEGWRLYSKLDGTPKVRWAEDALEIVRRDLELRSQLDKIATLDDIELDVGELNGHQLRPFQKVGVKFAEAAGFKCIIADQPGLGKSPQGISASLLLAQTLKREARVAVICPANLKRNWQIQIEKFTGRSASVFKGRQPTMAQLEKLMVDKPQWAIFNYDILTTKFQDKKKYTDTDGTQFEGDFVDRYVWIEAINFSEFDIILIDEAHYIKNVQSLRSKAVRNIRCPRVIFLTATPVMNRPRELWPLLWVINRELFPSYESFLQAYEDYDGKAKNAEELRQLLKPLMIRRLRKNVVKDLPPINRIYEFYELSEKGQRVYNKVLEGVYEKMNDWTPGSPSEQIAVTSILAQIMRLKQVCAIDKMDNVAELATELVDAAENGEASKVLIFSQFVPVARGIARRLGHEALCVTGQTPQEDRQNLVTKFQTDPSVKFMVATKGVLSEGVDLTKAGYVIFADLFWTPAAHEQCEGRAYGRLSELHGINSYYCVSKQEDGEESIEDWIQQILAKKLEVIETVVEGVEGSRNQSIANELLEKLRNELFSRRAR